MTDQQFNFTTNATDWRAQLRRNARRTQYVIAMFIVFYLAIGLLIDTYIYSGVYRNATLGQIFQALITLQLRPTVTFITIIIAIVSLLVTYTLYDKIMLLGTEYHQVTSDSESLEEKQLYNVVEELKIAAGLRFMPRIYIIEADYMNAFASGYSEKSAMVAITRGLMEKLDREELQAVMAHELSHIRHGDIKLTLTASVLSNILLIVVDFMFYNAVFSGRDREGRAGNQLVIIIIILRYLLPVTTLLLMMYLSRTREYMADAGCVELMRNNVPLARALLKIHQDHQQNSDAYGAQYSQTAHEDVRRAAYLYDPVQAGIEPVKSLANLFSTHPDIDHRLAALGVKRRVD
jgi:heat shock protein HtpX